MLTIGGRDISRIVNHLVYLEFSNWSSQINSKPFIRISKFHETRFNYTTTLCIPIPKSETTSHQQSHWSQQFCNPIKRKNPRIRSTTNLHKNEIQSTTRHNSKIIHELQGDVLYPLVNATLTKFFSNTHHTPIACSWRWFTVSRKNRVIVGSESLPNSSNDVDFELQANSNRGYRHGRGMPAV